MKQQINLYQAGMRSERPAFGAVTMAAGLGLCCTALFAAWLFATSHASNLQTELQAIQHQEAAAAVRLEKLTQTLASRDDDMAATSTLQEALQALKQRERLLNLIDGPSLGERQGFSGPLRALARNGLQGLWLTRIRVSAPGMHTTLEGHATAASLVPEYLLGLTGEEALSGQRFDQFEIERNKPESRAAVRFSMTSRQAQPSAGGGASR